MPAHDPVRRRLAAQVGASARWGTDATDAQRSLKAAKAEAYVRKLVESAPPLTSKQRAHLAHLLQGAP